jgi:hypothetical protein
MATEQVPPPKRAKPRERTFDLEDSLLMQRSRTIRQHFLNNQIAFEMFDGGLDVNFANDWLLAIEDCEAQPTDETMNDDLRIRTKALEEVRDTCFKKAGELEFLCARHFPRSGRYSKNLVLPSAKQ